MKVFLAGIIQGSRAEATIHDQDWRDTVKRSLAEHLPEAQVYDHFSLHPTSIEYDLPLIRSTFAEGLRHVVECDLLVAYLPGASMGTAIEMREAADNGAVVLTISPLAANWVVRIYSDRIFPDLAAFDAFLESGGARRLIETSQSTPPQSMRPDRT